MLVLQRFGAGVDHVLVVSAVWLISRMFRLVGAECLGSVGRILRSDQHSDTVIGGQDYQTQQDSRDEKSLRSSATFADLEDANPEEANAHGSDTRDGAAKKEKHQESHEDVVNGEGLGRLDEDEVHGLKDVDLAKDVTALLLANRVLGLVNTSDEHRYENDKGQEEEEDSTEELDGAEHSADLEPGLVDSAAAFTLSFGRESLTSNKCLFFSNQSIELSLILSGHTLLSASIAHLDLSLAFAVLLKLRSSGLMELGGRN